MAVKPNPLKRKLPSSVELENEQKRSRDMTVLEKNNALTKILDNNIPSELPGQQLSYHDIATLAKPGILDIDDDEDDNLTREERFIIEKESTEVMNNVEKYNTGLTSKIKNLRTRNQIIWRTPIEEDSSDSSDSSDGSNDEMDLDDEKQVPKEKAKDIIASNEDTKDNSKSEIKCEWNPLAPNAQDILDDLLTENDVRLLKSSAAYSLLESLQSLLVSQKFEQTQHFRNLISRYVIPRGNIVHINKDQQYILAYRTRDDEYASSPMTEFQVVYKLTSAGKHWDYTHYWMVPTWVDVRYDIGANFSK